MGDLAVGDATPQKQQRGADPKVDAPFGVREPAAAYMFQTRRTTE